MFKMLNECRKSKSNCCNLCSETLTETYSYPDICKDLFHYKCLRKYIDERLEKDEPILCPICSKYFGRIGNKHRNSEDTIYQNCILPDEYQCFICFTKYRTPVAYSDQCNHSYCYECYKKWCTCKHECPMDRLPVRMLLLCDFPGSHVIQSIEPPSIEHDINAEGDNDDVINTICEICHLGNNDDLLLLCDSCNKGYHMYCLRTPLTEIPEGDWYCDRCHQPSDDDDLSEFGILPRGVGRVVSNLEERIMNRGLSRNARRINTRSRTANEPNSLNELQTRENIITTRSRRNRILDDEEDEENNTPQDLDIPSPIAPVSATSNRRPLIIDSDDSDNEETQQQPTSTTLHTISISTATNIEEATSTTIEHSSHDQITEPTTSARPQRSTKNNKPKRKRKSKRKVSTRRSSSYRQESQSSELESEFNGNDESDTTTDDDFGVEAEEEENETNSSSDSSENLINQSNRSSTSRKRPSRSKSNRYTTRKKARVVYEEKEIDEEVNNNNKNYMIPSTSSASSAFGQNVEIESCNSSNKQKPKYDRNRHISSSSSSTNDTESTIPCRISDTSIHEEHKVTALMPESSSSSSSNGEENYQDDDDWQDDDDVDWVPGLTNESNMVPFEYRVKSQRSKVKPVRRSSRKIKKRRINDSPTIKKYPTRNKPAFARLMPTKYDEEHVLHSTDHSDHKEYEEKTISKYSAQSNHSAFSVNPATPVQQYSIIDSINESQSNLFRMTLTNINRQQDGTIKMKPESSSHSRYLITKPSSSSSTAVSTPSKSPPIPSLTISLKKSYSKSPNHSFNSVNNYSLAHNSSNKKQRPSDNADSIESSNRNNYPHISRNDCSSSVSNNDRKHSNKFKNRNNSDNVSSHQVSISKSSHRYTATNQELLPSTSSKTNRNEETVNFNSSSSVLPIASIQSSSQQVQSENNRNPNQLTNQDPKASNKSEPSSNSSNSKSTSQNHSNYKINKSDIEGSVSQIISKYFSHHIYSHQKYTDLTRKTLDMIKERVTSKVLVKITKADTVLTKDKLCSFVDKYIKYFREKKSKLKK